MLETTVTSYAQAEVIEVTGRVDSTNADDLRNVLQSRLDDGIHSLVVDLTNTDYMSSAGLRELVAGLKRAKQSGGDLRLCSANPRVTEVLQLAGLLSIFLLFPTRDAALESFNQPN